MYILFSNIISHKISTHRCSWRHCLVDQNLLHSLLTCRSAAGGGDGGGCTVEKKKNREEEVIFFFRKHRELLNISSFGEDKSVSDRLLNPRTGTQLHALLFKLGLGFHVQNSLSKTQDRRSVITWNVLISTIARRGDADRARFYFDQMKNRNIISYTCMIDAYIKSNKPKSAVSFFVHMIIHGVSPNHVCMITVLRAVSSIGVLHICQSLHSQIEKKSLIQTSIRLKNCLLDAYSKCGCIQSASRIFKQETNNNQRNLVSWTSIISAYAMHGMGDAALLNFNEMKSAGMNPNRVTFLSILNGCSHGGMLDLGLQFASKMAEEWGISPDVKHYGCIVDMLGRSEKVEEAEMLVLQVGGDEEQKIELWRTVLGACAVWGNVDIGERVLNKMVNMGLVKAKDYVLMCNILNGAGRYADADRVRTVIGAHRNMLKVVASSSMAA